MNSTRTHARNLAANWVGHGANLVVMFFLSPFIVHTLGKVEYGIWSLLTVLTGYMGMLDLGIQASTGRYVMLYVGRAEYDRVDETIRTGLGFYSMVGGLALAAALGIGWAFPVFFPSAPSGYHGTVRVLLPLLAINIWLSAFAAVMWSVLAAYDRFDLAQGLALLILAGRTVATVWALKAGYGILGLAGITIGAGAVAAIGTWAIAKRIHRPLRVWPLTLNRSRLRELLGYGIAASVATMAMKVIGQTGLVVVGAAIGVSFVAVYSIGVMLVAYSLGFIDQIGTTFTPPLQRAAAMGEMSSVRWLYIRQASLAMLCGLPILLGFIFFGKQFITLWMGPDFAGAFPVLVVLSLAGIAGLFSFGICSALSAIGYIRFNAVTAVLEAALNLGLSILFASVGWGLAGVAAGTLVSLLLVRCIAQPAYACFRLQLPWRLYVTRVVWTGLAAGGAIALCCLVVLSLVHGESWAMFWAKVACVAGSTPIVGWLFLVPTRDKMRFLKGKRFSGAGE